MSIKYKDRVMVTSSTTGTGTLSLGSAIVGHQSFSDALEDGDEVYVLIEEVDGDGLPTGAFEIGKGTWDETGGTLSRDLVQISSGGRPVPVIASKGAVTTGAAVTSLATGAPSGVVIGDRLLLIASCNNNSNIITVPDTWRLLRYRSASHTSSLYFFGKVADGTANDTPTLSFTSATIATVMYRITGVDPTRDVEVIDEVANGAIVTTMDIPAFDVTIDNCLQVAAIEVQSPAVTHTWPSPLAQETYNSTDWNLGVATAERDIGSVSAQAVTWSSGNRSALLNIVYRPAYAKVSFSNALRVSIIASANKLGSPKIETFTSSGIWTKEPWAETVDVICIGGGGGGSAGRARSSATGAGGGGSGGAITRSTLNASTLNLLETVTVGAGGAGGTTDSMTGSDGGTTSFGSHVYAPGGNNGVAPGSTTGGAGGAAVGTTGLFQQPSTAGGGGGSSPGTVGGTPANSSTVQCTGGGGGGGADTDGPVSQNGGAGGSIIASSVTVSAVAGGTAGIAETSAGGNGNSLEWIYGIPIGTGGGGGGGFGSGGNAFNGGNGGNYGGGGGGGGACDGSSVAGDGGNGAPGICVVVSY